MANIAGIGFIPDEIAYKDCGGTNGETAKTNGYVARKYIEAEKAKLIDQNGTIGIYKNANFDGWACDTIEKQTAKATAQKYAYYLPDVINGKEKGKRQIYLYGDVGTGKTWLASAIVNELSQKGLPCLFAKLSDIFEEIKSTFKSNETTEREVLIKYKTTKVLVIDDLGQEKASKWTNEKLFGLIDYRRSYGLATIYTSNCDPGELLEQLIPSDDKYNKKQAHAIVDRITGGAYKVPMYWESYRQEDE